MKERDRTEVYSQVKKRESKCWDTEGIVWTGGHHTRGRKKKKTKGGAHPSRIKIKRKKSKKENTA